MEIKYYLMKRGLYYRPDAAGYTSNVEEAGLYTEQEAYDHVATCGGEVKMLPATIKEEDAPPLDPTKHKNRLYVAINQAATAVHMLTAAEQVLVIVRHGQTVTINATEEATRENLMDVELLLVKTLNHVRGYRRELKNAKA